MALQAIPVRVDGQVREGDHLEDAILAAGHSVQDGDVLVFSQKIVSKQEGRLVRLGDIEPSELARGIASSYSKDPRIIELVLSESERIVRMRDGIIITKTRSGITCANAGIDQSNMEPGYAALLPECPDRSAARLRQAVQDRTGARVAVIISDTFGRPLREGQTDCAIGAAGIRPIREYAGTADDFGSELRVTAIAVADELCAAAELATGKATLSPVTIIRGYGFEESDAGSGALLREDGRDLFS